MKTILYFVSDSKFLLSYENLENKWLKIEDMRMLSFFLLNFEF